jgi:hypothetical protein
VDGSANVAFANKFVVQGTADAGLSGAQFLGSLGTGILKNTLTSGVLSIAIVSDFPTLNQNTTGSSGSCSGNSATVTNGIYTTTIGSYAPSLAGGGAYGTWSINITGASSSCSGNAATVTNGIYTTNINSYAPSPTGGGASGNWPINITGTSYGVIGYVTNPVAGNALCARTMLGEQMASTPVTQTELFNFEIVTAGTYRVMFDTYNSAGTNGHAYITKNGGAAISFDIINSPTYIRRTYDVTFAAGDTVQFMADTLAGSTTHIKRAAFGVSSGNTLLIPPHEILIGER